MSATTRTRVRVLQVITTTVGGAGEHVLQLASGLDRQRFDVTVAFAPGMPLDREFYRAGLRIVALPLTRRGGIIGMIRSIGRIYNLIRKEHIDIVHTHTSVAGAVGRVASKLARAPVTIHMVHAYAGHGYVRQPMRSIFRAVERVLDYFTDFYIAGSDAIRNTGIANGITADSKICTVPYALDRARFAAHGAVDLRRSLGLPPTSMIVGFVGRLEQQKGVDLLLEAFAHVSKAHPDVYCVIVGDGPQRSEMEALARELGLETLVRFLGWRTDVGAVMSGFDVLAVPSRWEAFGIVNLEAMASAVPIVAFAVEGIPEVVRPGKTGLLVHPEDVGGFAAALLTLLCNHKQRREMGLAGPQVVLERFDSKRMVHHHEMLYESLLAGKRPPAFCEAL